MRRSIITSASSYAQQLYSSYKGDLGTSFFHLVGELDPTHPVTTRVLKRLATEEFESSVLEGFSDRLLSDGGGHSPLTQAVFQENLLLTEWLLANGADPDSNTILCGPPPTSYAGNSFPIVHAALLKAPRLLKMLLKYGASVGVSRPPVHHRLCTQKASECSRYVRSMTPLQIAAYNGRFPNVRLLIFYGAGLEKGGDFARASQEPSSDYRTARAALAEGMTDELCMRETRGGLLSTRDCLGLESVEAAEAEFDAAVEAGFADRRLLVLGCFRRASRVELPDHVVQSIFDLANVFYPSPDH